MRERCTSIAAGKAGKVLALRIDVLRREQLTFKLRGWLCQIPKKVELSGINWD